MIKIDVFDNSESARKVFESFYELIVEDVPFPSELISNAFNSAFMERYPGAAQLDLRECKEKYCHSITDAYFKDLLDFGVVDNSSDKKSISEYSDDYKLCLHYTLIEKVISDAFPALGDFLYSVTTNCEPDNNMILESVNGYSYDINRINVNQLGKLLCGFMDDPEIISLRRKYDEKRNEIESIKEKINKDYGGSKNKKKREYELNKVNLPVNKLREYVFCYDKITKNKNKTYAFVNSIGVRVCPYCNRNYIQVIEKGQEKQASKEFQTRPQLDHFWNKSMYPFLAISMSNLVPSCAVCNLAKHDKNNNILYPYKEGLNDRFRFSIKTLNSIAYMTKLQGSESEFGLEITKNSFAESAEYDEKVKNSADTFGWDETYESDKKYALKVYQNSYVFNIDFQRSIVDAMPDLFPSTEDVRHILNPKLVSNHSFNSEPLSKLTHDIAEQARSDEEDILDEIIYEEIIGIKKTKRIDTKYLIIRSGAQSGVDRAALDFARKHNIKICGWCPRGGWAEDYPEVPGVLSLYPELNETPEAETWQRTLWNIRDADAVLTIIPVDTVKSSGTELGKQEAEKLHKLCFTAHGVEDIPKIAGWLEALLMVREGATELCVGGPRASECQEAYQITTRILEGVWEFLKSVNGILEESD